MNAIVTIDTVKPVYIWSLSFEYLFRIHFGCVCSYWYHLIALRFLCFHPVIVIDAVVPCSQMDYWFL